MFFHEKYILLIITMFILMLFIVNCTLINRTPVDTGFNKSVQQGFSKIATVNQWVIIYLNFIIIGALFVWLIYEFIKTLSVTVHLTGDDPASPENIDPDAAAA